MFQRSLTTKETSKLPNHGDAEKMRPEPVVASGKGTKTHSAGDAGTRSSQITQRYGVGSKEETGSCSLDADTSNQLSASASLPALDNLFLYTLATQLSGGEWEALAIHLDFTDAVIQRFKSDYQGFVVKQAYQMLLKWTQGHPDGVDQQAEQLVAALRSNEVGRIDLAKKIKDQVTFPHGHANQTDALLDEPGVDNKTLFKIAKQLGRDWEELAILLEITNAAVQNIKCDYQYCAALQAYQMLVKWRRAHPGSVEQQTSELSTALGKIGRDIAQILKGSGAQSNPEQDEEPDCGPSLRSPNEETGNKIKAILMRVYKRTGSYVQLIPTVDNDEMHIPGIYTKVQLKTREGVAVVGMGCHNKEEIVNSTEYAKILGAKTRTGDLIKRVIFFGMGGVGKSTILHKIAYDWADQTSQVLAAFKLVLVLKMFSMLQNSDLVESTFNQLLGEDCGVSKDALEAFILANSSDVLILLDGFDEMRTKSLDETSFGSILKALNGRRYRECFICVSTRPSHLDRLMEKRLIQNPCTHVEVLGFTESDVREYVRKFHQNIDDGAVLIETIEKSSTLRDLARIPMLLLLMCLLWRESQRLPETTSRLFKGAIDYIFLRKAKVSIEKVSKTVTAIGETALRGLMDADQKCSFQEDEFEPCALELALEAGILTRQRVFKNLQPQHSIQFMHKTMQEYCAAKFLQSLNVPNRGLLQLAKNTFNSIKFSQILNKLCCSINSVVSNEYLFRFCCGDNEKCMTEIVQKLGRCIKTNKNQSKYDSKIIQAISQNCFFESQSSSVPAFLDRASIIPSRVDVSNDYDLSRLVYLIEIICKSDSCKEQLTHVQSVSLSGASFSQGLAKVLSNMDNLESLLLIDCNFTDITFEKALLSMKCNNVLDVLCIDGDQTLGGRGVEWAPHIRQLINMRTFQLKRCKLQPTDIEHIASSLSEMPRLNELTLSGNIGLGGSADSWSKYLLRMKHVKTLDLSNCSLQEGDAKHLSTSLNGMPCLTSLILADNQSLAGSAHSWSKNLPRMAHIQTLSLRNCSVQSTDIKHIAWSLGDMPKLTHLVLADNKALGGSADSWSQYLARMRYVKTLDLSNCSLQKGDVKHLSTSLNSMPCLTSLILAENKTLGGSANFWSQCLSQMKHIQTLNLRYCSLQWTDIAHIARFVGDMHELTELILTDNAALGEMTSKWSLYLLRTNKHTLNLSYCSLKTDDFNDISFFIHHIPEIRTLNLSKCSLQPANVEHIASIVDDMPGLTDLILAENTLLGGSASMWSRYLPRMTHIRTLNLNKCSLQPADFEHIASSIGRMPRLTDLILAENTLLGASANMWSRYLSRMTHIRTLNLNKCSLQPADVEHIASSIGHMPGLTDLILAENTSLGGSANMWSRYLPRMTHIRTLNLNKCSLQPADVEHIASSIGHMPRLTDLILAENTSLGELANLWSQHLLRMTENRTLTLGKCSLQPTEVEHMHTKNCSLVVVRKCTKTQTNPSI
ncbi:NACHT, LRR and PYD domains-containing protein 2-like [Acanthaster planci]|uniref:NACHT, LRR and PYD domains-containing protein 2-like n=1 Tax=Acanthaster planci TaxID=133434 RepID=A0A8B7ZNA3_ACAPL|nr:NACHT, LRR and PYD domains-containing protein 2-like [Acanthaster planci]